ncbi:MAG TPA: hypothetical protein VEL76_41970 [Gemmataceae bacterium]|nr:hypothetical protein [Gemmataceae bacterium]
MQHHTMSSGGDFLAGLMEGNWSPRTRLFLGLAGGGLLAYGLTRRAPTACILGSIGLALLAESAFNVGVKDLMPSSGGGQQTAAPGRNGGQSRAPSKRRGAIPAALNRL